MIDKSAAQNYAFKARVALFVWAVFTGLAWYAMDKFLDEALSKEFHIFLEASLASFAPLHLFGNKPAITIEGHSYDAAELARTLLGRDYIKDLCNKFFVYLPAITAVATGLIFFLLKKEKNGAVEIQHQLNKWSGE